jgi:hypothetical protein
VPGGLVLSRHLSRLAEILAEVPAGVKARPESLHQKKLARLTGMGERRGTLLKHLPVNL